MHVSSIRHRVAWVLGIVCFAYGGATFAQDSAPAAPVDSSKNGSVEAEITPTRESTKEPLSNATVEDLLSKKHWDRGGFFLGMTGHYSVENSEEVGGGDKFASSGGASLRIGLKHNRYWTTEFSGIYNGKFKSDGGEFWAWGVALGERFYLTKTRVQPYIGVAAGFLQVRDKPSKGDAFGFSPKFSTGFDTYVNENINITFDLTYYLTVGGIDDSDFVTAGIGFTWF